MFTSALSSSFFRNAPYVILHGANKRLVLAYLSQRKPEKIEAIMIDKISQLSSSCLTSKGGREERPVSYPRISSHHASRLPYFTYSNRISPSRVFYSTESLKGSPMGKKSP